MSFGYDAQLAALAGTPVQTIQQVIDTLESIDALLDGALDGLKWFNQLYLQVTRAVEAQVSSPEDFIAVLDVQFANLYFSALSGHLDGGTCPACWRILFERRADLSLARIQFAIAGINAHIDFDLSQAIVETCKLQGFSPEEMSPQYAAFTALNAILDSLIETAKTELLLNLPGDRRLTIHDAEWVVAAWTIKAARAKAWDDAEIRWRLRAAPGLAVGFDDFADKNAEMVGSLMLTAF
jgi:hypothetical protein